MFFDDFWIQNFFFFSFIAYFKVLYQAKLAITCRYLRTTTERMSGANAQSNANFIRNMSILFCITFLLRLQFQRQFPFFCFRSFCFCSNCIYICNAYLFAYFCLKTTMPHIRNSSVVSLCFCSPLLSRCHCCLSCIV